ncbi:membrane-associated protein, putative [Bodo saltans]|uniref:Membrane-associated protein, putative n=1 Tax=Bodo saltans TaxID=75058 RepID=A0A0S4JDT7_BODSA|nr:membrane-associated protein, putative [Bodo saltans]|eukprot:CUG86517.1 membrane-associated protein, putative [Bodo saltans]
MAHKYTRSHDDGILKSSQPLRALPHAFISVVVVYVVVLTQLSLIPVAQSADPQNVSCVTDPVAPFILRNTSLSVAAKVALYNANIYQYSNWFQLMRAYNKTYVNVTTPPSTPIPAPPEKPHLCPQISAMPIFRPGDMFYLTFDNTAVTTITNATTAGVLCGFDNCFVNGSSTGHINVSGVLGVPLATRPVVGQQEVTEVINGTTFVYNESILGNTSTYVSCFVQTPVSMSLDTVCTAYIQYNATYWENGSVYAMTNSWSNPSASAAILDTTLTTDFVAGNTSTIGVWLPAGLTSCPWYYNVSGSPAVEAASGNFLNGPTVGYTITYRINSTLPSPYNTSVIQQFGSAIPLEGWVCESASPHPTTGVQGIRYRGTVSPYQFSPLESIFTSGVVLDYNLSISSLSIVYFALSNDVTVANYSLQADGTLPLAKIKYFPTMIPKLSGWAPMEDYSLPDKKNILRRCYNTTPRAFGSRPTKLYFPTLSVGAGGWTSLDVEMLNATTFCCSVRNPAADFKWLAYIAVYETGVHWFTDMAGITITPTPSPRTLAPPPPEPTNASGDVIDSSSSSSIGDVSSSSSSSNGGTTASPDGENIALILGACLVGAAALITLIVFLYSKWWKPKHSGAALKDEIEARHSRREGDVMMMMMRMPQITTDGALNPESGGGHAAKKRRGGGRTTSDGMFDETSGFSHDL